MDRFLKPDAELIVQHLKELEKSLGKSRSWWPRFLFHFTNIDNAVKILESGSLMCRSLLEKSGEMETDNASPEIIERTDDKWKEYVRLYFRPRTPTQFRNEGFRPEGQRTLNAHCPVPVYFLFDARKMLARSRRFSISREGWGDGFHPQDRLHPVRSAQRGRHQSGIGAAVACGRLASVLVARIAVHRSPACRLLGQEHGDLSGRGLALLPAHTCQPCGLV